VENAAAPGCDDMSGHYENERDIWSRLQQTSQELAELHLPVDHLGHKGPNRLRVVAPDVKPNRPGRYRPGKPKP
jgi:hypothetical protein